jgi:hypothetical protein
MKTPREILLGRNKSAEPKLDRLWNETLAPRLSRDGAAVRPNLLFAIGWKLWRELILPSWRIWAGLACAWVVIVMLNLASSEPASEIVSNVKPPSREEVRALVEQRQMLTQLIGSPSEPANAQKRVSPGPRSDRTRQISAA